MSQGLLIERDDYVGPLRLWDALRAHEDCAGVGGDAQDSFSFGAVRALAFEPLAHPSLHPEKWKKLNAGLDISVRLTKKGRLAIDVAPWRERCNLAARKDRFEDFVNFPGDEDAPDRPTCTLFELPLDELKSELRGAGANLEPAAVSARRLVHLSYEHVLRILARHFQVRVQTALLCLGDECRLHLRKMSSLENQVEQPQRWSSAFSWHGRYLALCAQAGVAPDELLELYQVSLQPLSESGRLAYIRQYLGNPSTPVVRRGRGRTSQAVPDPTTELLRALTVVASPAAFPPLIEHPSKAVEKQFLQMLRAAPLAGAPIIAEQYCVEVSDVQQLLRQHYPTVLLATLVSPLDMREELEYFMGNRADQLKVIDELQQRILLNLGREWDKTTLEDLASRKRKLGKLVGFSSFQALKEWAQQYAAPMMYWLNSL